MLPPIKSGLYLDHAASTRPCDRIVEEISEFSRKFFGNSHSSHTHGQASRAVIEKSRYAIEQAFPKYLVTFTSGATESLHLGIIGHVLAQKKTGSPLKNLYYSPLAHPALLSAVGFVRDHLNVSVNPLDYNECGHLQIPKAIEKGDLCVIEHGNSEVGIRQPIEKFADFCHKYQATFLCDSAAGLVSNLQSINSTHPHMVVFSGEKIGGLSGSGVLLHDRSVPLSPLQAGAQENGLRAGTHSALSIWALGIAVTEHVCNYDETLAHFKGLQKYSREFFHEKFSDTDIYPTLSEETALPHIFHITLPSTESQSIVAQCDIRGLSVSSGNACSSGSQSSSPTLDRITNGNNVGGGIRLSFGKSTRISDIQDALLVILDIFKTLK